MANNRMRRYARMAMAANGGRNNVKVGDYSGNRIENYYGRMEDDRMGMRYAGERMNYNADARFRDRRGRWHYDNGRFAPRSEMGSMGGDMNYSAENRRGGRRARSDFDTETYAPWGPYGEDDEDDDGRAMNKIGFSLNGEMGHPWEFDREYRSDAGYRPINEMERRMGTVMGGRAVESGNMKLDHEKAKEWVASMQNEDGSRGAHWTMEQTRQIQNQKGLASLDPMRFWVTMNMMYSDYCSVFEKAGISKPDLYADLAKAFLMDKDAHKDKLDRYWFYVVKR